MFDALGQNSLPEQSATTGAGSTIGSSGGAQAANILQRARTIIDTISDAQDLASIILDLADGIPTELVFTMMQEAIREGISGNTLKASMGKSIHIAYTARSPVSKGGLTIRTADGKLHKLDFLQLVHDKDGKLMGGIVRELKPDTLRGRNRGLAQLRRYLKAARERYGGDNWIGYVDTYSIR